MAFPTGWLRKHKITVDNTKVSGSSDLTNFPILLTEVNFLASAFSNSDNGGGDIRFSLDEAGSNQLACEIVTWDTSTSKAEVWVKIPTLSYNTDTDIYVWYDKTGETQPVRTDTYGSDNVYRSEYKLVAHLTNTVDSTANAHDGTKSSGGNPADTTGKIGGAQEFTSDLIDFGDHADFDFGTGEFAIGVWARADYSPSAVQRLFGKIQNSGDFDNFLLEFNASGFVSGAWRTGGTQYDATDNTDFTDGTWRRFWLVRKSTGLYVYVNGVEEASNTNAAIQNNEDNSDALVLGSERSGTTASGFPGTLDEFVVWKGTAPTVDWLITEYNNQNSPNTFSVATAIGVNDERSARIIGQITVNSEIGAKLTGTAEIDERDAKITGQDTTESERDATLKGTFRIPRRLNYKIIAKNASGAELGVVDTYKALKFGKRLNNFGMCEFEMLVGDSKMSSLVDLRKNTFDIYREEGLVAPVLVWSGEQAVRRSRLDTNRNNWSTIYSYTWLEQLKNRYTADEIQYLATDAGEIAWDLIDTTQTGTNASLGITEGTIEASTDRDRTYYNQNIMEAIVNLSNVISGFDFEITDTKVFNVYNLLGEDKTEDVVLIYGKNIKNVEILEDFSNPVNKAIVLGEAIGQTNLQRVERNNTTKQTEYKIREGVFSEMDVSNLSTLQDKGDAALRKYQDVLFKVDFDLIKGSSPNITDFGVGDGITLVINDGIYNISGQFRVYEWEVEFDSNNTERLSLTMGDFISIPTVS